MGTFLLSVPGDTSNERQHPCGLAQAAERPRGADPRPPRQGWQAPSKSLLSRLGLQPLKQLERLGQHDFSLGA